MEKIHPLFFNNPFRKLFFPFINLLLCYGSSCTKQPDKPTAYFSQEFKDYTYFNQGSYWIYQDSANHNIKDSTIITSQNLYISAPRELSFNSEQFAETRFSSIYGKLGGGLLFNHWKAMPFMALNLQI